MDKLASFRQEIDTLDQQIIEVLGRRFDICRQVAFFKKEQDVPMMQPGRVAEVKQRCEEMGLQRGMSREFMAALYSLIIQESCRIETEIIGDE